MTLAPHDKTLDGPQKPVRLGCGHYADVDRECPECFAADDSPDPWDLAGGRDMRRLEENRAYRQSKYRA